MNRRWLIAISLVAHIGLGVFLFATGVWRIERLEAGRAELALAVMLPPAAPEGGPAPGEKPKDPVTKPTKKKVDQIVQPEKVDPALAKAPASPTTSTGTGDGSGSGAGSGTGTGKTPCDDCVGDGTESPKREPACGDRIKDAGEQCDDGNTLPGDGCSATCKIEVALVPPTVLQGLRISGETQVHPPDTVKTEMLRDNRERTAGTLKLCIGADGGISSVAIAASTKYPEYDARLVAAVRSWRYQAYTVNNRPVPVCSTVTFIYSIK